MVKNKVEKLFSRLLREIFNLFKILSRQLMLWLLRSYFVLNRWRQAQAGFVLPTVALMMIVVFMVVTAVMFRTFSRNTQVIRDYQTQQVVNAATPALDRAKAKIEALFNTDLAGNPPTEDTLEKALLTAAYDYPGETRLIDGQIPGIADFDGDGNNANALNVWKYTDASNKTTTVYGIVLRGRRDRAGTTYSIDQQDTNPIKYANDKAEGGNPSRSDLWLVRNGPIATTILNKSNACNALGSDRMNAQGWFAGNGTSTVYKNIQVYAVSMPSEKRETNKSVATVGYQQDRLWSTGNKWGAWFRYDLEMYPGENFNWNGAMHSQGSIFSAPAWPDKRITNFLISSPESCYFTPETNSAITFTKQMVGAQIRDNKFNDPNNVTIDTQQEGAVGPSLTFNKDSDSVDVKGSTPIDISTDPLRLLVRNEGETRTARSAQTWLPDTNFESNKNFVGSGDKPRALRLDPARSCAPYIDDTYRADNRMGPKPSYSREIPSDANAANPNQSNCLQAIPQIGQGENITGGTTLATSISTTSLNTNDIVRDDPLGASSPETVGLDGFWERRARSEGLRVIVGQRLELGNPYGWDTTDDTSTPPVPNNPLFPPDKKWPTWAASRKNEGRQMRTLQDNLAAVQATAIYNSKVNKGYFPTSCLATTVHPGTPHTLAQSATFQTMNLGSGSPYLLTNFFYGEGTNGWEFNAPASDEATFASNLGAGKPLRKALDNLAHFAGDKDGAFPPLQKDGEVHPNPNMTMWGDFSNLRRALENLTTLGSYQNLSIADKSYLHSAACTLGMLAYNISYINSYNPTPQEITDINNKINPIVSAIPSGSDPESKPDYILAELDRPALAAAAKEPKTQADVDAIKLAIKARMLHLKEQIKYDLNNGSGYICNVDTTLCDNIEAKQSKFPALYYIFPTAGHQEPTNAAIQKAHNRDSTVRSMNTGYQYQGFAVTPSSEIEKLAITPKISPSNYTLPLNQLQASATGNKWQLPVESYPNANNCNNYRSLNFTNNSSGNIAPKNMIRVDAIDTAAINSRCLEVGFKDSAIFDGRELMSVRLLNLDLNLLRNKIVNPTDSSDKQDTWLPISGIVYAFREDAVREDAIARSPLMAANSYADYSDPGAPKGAWPTSKGDPSASNRMNVWDASKQDPPQIKRASGDTRGISPKPVDYYPDPDRRPYGFRLRNGSDLRRMKSTSTTTPISVGTPPTQIERTERGISFISDNPVYIQGDFNLHYDGNAAQEEFTEALTATNFYTRKKDQLNKNFAEGNDWWRQSEVLGDSVTILSKNWICDGTIQNGILDDTTGCGSTTSYSNGTLRGKPGDLNTAPPNSSMNVGTLPKGFECENPFDTRSANFGALASGTNQKGCDSPIKIARNGDIKYTKTSGTDFGETYGNSQSTFKLLSDTRNRITAQATTVNAVLVSGTTPTRVLGGNGGFHNFPRLLEDWKIGGLKPLKIAGSFLQLNFSNYATAPYDQDAWEPSSNPGSAELIKYYEAPLRSWGYDVGLQKTSAGPVSRRLQVKEPVRSEFFREPPTSDPYICKLRRVIEPNAGC